MKKLLFIFLLLPFFAAAQSQWLPAGQNQISRDTFNVRVNMGKYGNKKFYKALQIDSLFHAVPLGFLADSNNDAASKKWVKQLSYSLNTYFSPSYVQGSGSFGDPFKVGNSDSLGHKNASAYALINGTNTLRTAANFGQTASEADVAHWPDPGTGDNSYIVSGWLNIATNPSAATVTMQVTFTYSSTSWTLYFFPRAAGSTTLPTSAVLSTINYYSLMPLNFRVTSGTTIQVSTTVVGTGMIYEDGATIQLVK